MKNSTTASFRLPFNSTHGRRNEPSSHHSPGFDQVALPPPPPPDIHPHTSVFSRVKGKRQQGENHDQRETCCTVNMCDSGAAVALRCANEATTRGGGASSSSSSLDSTTSRRAARSSSRRSRGLGFWLVVALVGSSCGNGVGVRGQHQDDYDYGGGGGGGYQQQQEPMRAG